jgi:hypothetical protein
MTLYVLDTDLLSLYQRNHPQVCTRIRLARQNGNAPQKFQVSELWENSPNSGPSTAPKTKPPACAQ